MERAFYFANLEELIDAIPPDSILSRTIYQDSALKTILFGFQPGQELSEHTAAVPAVLHFLQGKAALELGGEARSAQAGTWVRLPANLPHSIMAEEKTLMLLMLFPQPEGD